MEFRRSILSRECSLINLNNLKKTEVRCESYESKPIDNFNPDAILIDENLPYKRFRPSA